MIMVVTSTTRGDLRELAKRGRVSRSVRKLINGGAGGVRVSKKLESKVRLNEQAVVVK